MRHPNISIGQRMAVGFGLLIATLLALVAGVFASLERSARVQAEFTEFRAPLAARAAALDRSILYVGIGARAFLLSPRESKLEFYRQTVDDARSALAALRQHPKDADSEARYLQLEPLVERYLLEADRLIEVSVGGEVSPAAESALARAREAAVMPVREFATVQDENAAAALAAMAETRERMSDSLVVGTAVAALLCLALCYFTAQSIRRPTRELLRVAGALMKGDWKAALAWAPAPAAEGPASPPVRNEMVQLAQAFGAAAAALERREQRLRADRQLSAAVSASLDRTQVADVALRVIVEHVRAQVGVMYWKTDDADMLAPIARHALAGEVGSVSIGSGIPGEAARQRRTIVARDIPRDSPFRIKLGYDEAPPRAVAAVPVAFRGELLGVLLVATLADFDEAAISFLDAASAELAIGLKNVEAYEEIQQLLGEMRLKNEQIQEQNQALQAQNEEIQAQSEEIQAQHEEIQTQSEELQAQNEQLRQQTDELHLRAASLSEADARKNEFLGFLAHELRNPMAAIANSLFILKHAGAGSERAGRAQAIMERQARHLTRLIDDLLDITRISHGKIELERQRLDLVDVVRECIADHQPFIETRRLTLDVAIAEEPVWVDGDRTRLSQVLGNLLSNAIKFTDDGKSIAVRLHRDEARRCAELRVVDSGMGIEPDLLPHLFQPFSQGVTGLARTKGGLGLGLALVKTLVELHDGTVRVDSSGAGKGAEFRIRLPLQAAPVHSTAAAAPPRKSWRMLIVEDNADAAESLRSAVELEGHHVEVAAAGDECLRIAREFRPEVVLCDIGLPNMDWYEVACRLREDEHTRSALLIAVSGYASPRDEERAAAAGFDRHLAKPLSMEKLASTLAELAAPAPTSG